MRRKIILSIILLLSLSSLLYAEIELYSTYYQNIFVNKFEDDWFYGDQNLLYLKLRKPFQGDYDLKCNLSFSVSNLLGSENSAEFDIQRLNFRTGLDRLEFTVGRFLPEYKYTNFFQPVNIFLGPQFLQNELVFTGIDGISIKRYMGMLSSVQYVSLPKFQMEQSSHYLNFTSNVAGFDFSLLAHYKGDTYTKSTGFGFKGDLVVGLSHETLVKFENTDSLRFTSATGIDYSFDKFMIMLEYLYNENMLSFATEGLFALQDTHYLYLNGFYFESLGKTIGLSGITNLRDSSTLLSAYYMNEIFNGVTVSVGVYAPVSEDEMAEFHRSRVGDITLNAYLRAKF
ncbi:MAG: hypothetical protein JXB42_11565 [Deltaproteobacteria bacterium]|nr:hypothetical protein [Deltaproteobacteria bacterium]